MGVEDDRRKDLPRERPNSASDANDGSGKGGGGAAADAKDLTGPRSERAAERSKIERDVPVSGGGGGPPADFKDLTGPKIDRPAEHSKIEKSSERPSSEAKSEKGSGLAQSSSEAWAHPGSFHVVKDGGGHTTRLEGWLSLREGRRGGAEHDVQREARSAYGMQSGTDSGHILGYALGGPAAAQCSRELALANQLPMDARVNRSYVAGMEAQLRRDLQSGKQIYVQADVRYHADKGNGRSPESVQYSFFEKGPDGSKQPCQGIQSVVSRVDLTPSETAGQAVRNVKGGQAADFSSPDRKGALGTEWPDGH